jgi:hypothetical protein
MGVLLPDFLVGQLFLPTKFGLMRSMLLIGPPGSGRDIIAESLAQQYGASIIHADGLEQLNALSKSTDDLCVFVTCNINRHHLPPSVAGRFYSIIECYPVFVNVS